MLKHTAILKHPIQQYTAIADFDKFVKIQSENVIKLLSSCLHLDHIFHKLYHIFTNQPIYFPFFESASSASALSNNI